MSTKLYSGKHRATVQNRGESTATYVYQNDRFRLAAGPRPQPVSVARLIHSRGATLHKAHEKRRSIVLRGQPSGRTFSTDAI